jgi:hypothetical protein
MGWSLPDRIRIPLVLAVLVAPACGGGQSGPKPPPPPPEEEIVSIPAAKPDREPDPEPAPVEAAAREWHARAELAPVKRAKLKRGVVMMSQIEGEGMSLTIAFAGVKAGRYHFVVHEGSTCGKNATAAGRAWAAAAGVDLRVQVARKSKGPITKTDVALTLGGDDTIVGRTLVLHADKKGKPHKVLACGVIIADDVEAEPEADGED